MIPPPLAWPVRHRGFFRPPEGPSPLGEGKKQPNQTDVSRNVREAMAELLEGHCMWEDSHYCWVVRCKNHWFHVRENIFFRHRIPLGETDAVASLPALNGPFKVRCDVCGKEYSYKPAEVLKFEQELPESFTSHPLFRS
jgi:hypothetical protein